MWNSRGYISPRQGLAGAGPLPSVGQQAAGQGLQALHPATSLHPSSSSPDQPQQHLLPGQGPWGMPSQRRAFLAEEQAGGRVDVEHAGVHAPPVGILWFLVLDDVCPLSEVWTGPLRVHQTGLQPNWFSEIWIYFPLVQCLLQQQKQNHRGKNWKEMKCLRESILTRPSWHDLNAKPHLETSSLVFPCNLCELWGFIHFQLTFKSSLDLYF